MCRRHVVLISVFTGHVHRLLLVSLLLSFRHTHRDFGTCDKKYSHVRYLAYVSQVTKNLQKFTAHKSFLLTPTVTNDIVLKLDRDMEFIQQFVDNSFYFLLDFVCFLHHVCFIIGILGIILIRQQVIFKPIRSPRFYTNATTKKTYSSMQALLSSRRP
jgi:hypothetical protein